MTKRVLIIGLGRFGQSMANELWDNGVEIIGLDSHDAALDSIKHRTQAVFVGDATDPEVLRGVGAAEVDAAVVSFGECFEAAVLCVAALRKLGVKEIVSRATTAARAEVLRAVGATRVHEVEKEMGGRAAIALITPVATDLLDLANQFRVVPWTAAGPLVGQTLSACGLRSRFGLNVIGIRPATHGASANLIQPTANYLICEGDTLLLVGEDSNVSKFARSDGR